MSSTTITDKQDNRRAWFVAIGAMLCMVAASVPLSGLGFFHPYIFAVMVPQGATQSSILFYITLEMLAIVASMMFIGGPLLPKLGTKKLMVAGTAIVAGGLVIFANATTPVMLYVAGVVLGLGYGASYQLVPMVWVNNWFVAKKGLVVGLVTGGTGIGGVIWSIVVPAIAGTPSATNTAYRFGYYVMAVVVIVLTLTGALILATPERPSLIGLLPLGSAERDTAKQIDARELTKPVPGLPFATALRSPWLWLLFASSVLLGIVHGAAQIMSTYLTDRVTSAPPIGLGKELAFYSLLMSIWTIGLIFLKPMLGVLNDKLGVIPAMAIALAMQSAFFLFLPKFAQFGTIVPMIMMLMMSAGMSTGTVEPPLITAQAMGPRDFGKIWSIAGSAFTLGSAVGAPIWGMFYDEATRSYTMGFQLAPFALALVVVGSFIGMKMGKRQYTKLYEKELAEWEAENPA